MPKSKLPINFSDESNRYAYHLYRALLERGITDDEMDLGWTENKNTETHTNDSYSMQGEFSTIDQLRTSIQGKIWKQSCSS